jgi:abortive infection bacteriophage resistance protein
VRFSKAATTIDEQVALILERGMQIDDIEAAKKWLEGVGYYRMSAYWLPFEEPPAGGQTRSKTFKPGTNFTKVRDLYVFDRRLRLLLLEAIERIEIHVRSRWTYRMSHAHGPHAHLDHKLFAGAVNHAEQLVRLARAVEKSEETFIQHYCTKYTEPFSPPLWASTELMTMGELSKWVQATKDNSIKSAVARDIGLPTRETLEGTLQVFAYIRNICAHHGRLWNRRLVKRLPYIKRYRGDLVITGVGEQRQPDNRIYNVITVLLQLLYLQATDSTYFARLRELIDGIEEQDRAAMGFPDDWRGRPAWNL